MSEDIRRKHRDLTKSERKESRKQLKAEQSAPPPCKDKRLILRRIATDTAEPNHIRAEARHLLDIGDVRPLSEFDYRFREFMESRQHESNQ